MDYNLYIKNDKIEESMLRSALIFNDRRQDGKRADMIDMDILSILIWNNQECTYDKIINLFKTRFNVTLAKDSLSKSISNLKSMGLVSINDGCVRPVMIDANGVDFFRSLEVKTSSLINGIVDKAAQMRGVVINDRERALLNVKNALSAYYRMYGLSFFDIQQSAQKEETEDAVSIVRDSLNQNVGNALVQSLSETIQNPSEQEKDVLESWARAYVSMQVMGIDPALRNFKATKLKGKTFVLDTDVVLNCITTNARFSAAYHEMIKKLKESGCVLIIPDEVVREVENHADAAITRYRTYGNAIKEYTDELLEGKVSNVFIEDYVKTIRKDSNKKDMSFLQYMDNIYRSDDMQIILLRFKSVFGGDIFDHKLNAVINGDDFEKLKNLVYEYTMYTEKAGSRTQVENEEISAVDASLYLMVTSKATETDSQHILDRGHYLVTRTTRTIKCAKELGFYVKDIVCNPNVLSSILQEVGSLSDKSTVFNLFENPFLVYTSKEIWSSVQPLLDAGASIKYNDYVILKHDFDTKFDKLLTSSTEDERYQAASEVTDRGYLFAADLVNSVNREAALRLERDRLEEELKQAKLTIKKYEDTQRSLRGVTGKSAVVKSNRTKKGNKHR